MKADLVELVGETDLWFKYLMVQERGVLKLQNTGLGFLQVFCMQNKMEKVGLSIKNQYTPNTPLMTA